jgi:hypothetical protein
MQLNSISDLIDFIEVTKINDFDIIDNLAFEMIGQRFCPIRFSNKPPITKDYYVKWLKKYEYLMNENLELPIFIDTEYPFTIQQVYKKK